MSFSRHFFYAKIALAALSLPAVVSAAPLYSVGFEAGSGDWTSTQAVASGTGGVTSADGANHGLVASNAFTRFGGFNFGAGSVPTAFQAFTTSIDIFLNVGGSFANDSKFDYSSAISNAAGVHRRDFIFSGGFYNAASTTGPGTGADRFVFSVSNNAPGWPANPARSPIAITTSGWYTFVHNFYDDNGVLAVDMNIVDDQAQVLGSWTLSDASDLTASVVGGSRYGWFTGISPSLGRLAIDNVSLSLNGAAAVPEPGTLALAGLALAGLGFARRKRAA